MPPVTVAHRDARWQPTANRWPPEGNCSMLLAVPGPGPLAAQPRRKTCKLSVASDVDDSAPPSMPLSNASDKIQAETRRQRRRYVNNLAQMQEGLLNNGHMQEGLL